MTISGSIIVSHLAGTGWYRPGTWLGLGKEIMVQEQGISGNFDSHELVVRRLICLFVCVWPSRATVLRGCLVGKGTDSVLILTGQRLASRDG